MQMALVFHGNSAPVVDTVQSYCKHRDMLSDCRVHIFLHGKDTAFLDCRWLASRLRHERLQSCPVQIRTQEHPQADLTIPVESLADMAVH